MENSQMNLDETLINRLKNKIVIAESRNLKSKEKNDTAMVNEIKKTIEEAVKQCCSNQ